MNLIYIGIDFYWKSRTSMSPIYRVDEDGDIVERYDWGFVENYLRQGHEIHIVQANTAQMLWAYKKLESILESHVPYNE